MPQANSLQVTALSRRENGKLLADNLSFGIPPQSRIALVGLNGAGKSSLIRLLAGVDRPTSGNIKWEDNLPCALAFKKQLGYQPSGMGAIAQISCREYLMLCCQTRLYLSNVYQTAIDEVTQQWHLNDIIDRPMTQLSQGNLQKISIAQAFLGRPDFILLDEPTQALDPIEQQRFIDNLIRLEDFKVCLFSSHHINEAVQMADKVILMHHGKLIAVLDLQVSDEYWLLSQLPLEQLQKQFAEKNICVVYRQGEKQLYKIGPLSLSEWQTLTNSISKMDGKAQMLGTAQQALMPLFTLLANEEL